MLLTINSWWASMEILEKIFWGFALPFSVVFLIQLIMTLIGFGADGDIDASGDADMEVETDTGIGFQFITLKNFMAFFTIFGWTGIACLDAGLSDGLTIFLAIVAGVLMMLLMAALFFLMGKLTESGNAKMENAIGKTASVYLRIPAAKSGMGKVQVNVQGLKTLDAMTENPEDIKSGSLVKVVAIEAGEILMVELL
ncbi:MAG TPA: NfeD family protein [Bacteroidales bacterium]|nr:NfeD family protein [Bacteroidales bacterium]